MKPSVIKHKMKTIERTVEIARMVGSAFSPTGYLTASSRKILYIKGQLMMDSIDATISPMKRASLIMMNVRVRCGLRGPSHSGN